MKIGMEDTIKELESEHAIILRPGLIIGRESPKAFLEYIVGKLPQDLRDKTNMTLSMLGYFEILCSLMTYRPGKSNQPWASGLMANPDAVTTTQ